MSWKGWDANTINLQEERIEELEQINAEMLAALERFVSGMEATYDAVEQSGLYNGRPTDIEGGPIHQARAAIAKAKGE